MDKGRWRAIKVRVLTLSPASRRGLLCLGGLQIPCALGKGGIRALKREGDGASPRGEWAFRRGLYRADRIRRPVTGLRLQPIKPQDGWCDAPADGNYNRPVQHPYRASAEHLWRSDGLYDLVLVLGYNDVPRTKGRGSAIFMHVARLDLAPTEGCVALALKDLLKVVRLLKPGASLRIG
jgi:L,D-peptidoglycan transpeptidase YkuD (ErfK/YbiS/YcfS/YnhG family)